MKKLIIRLFIFIILIGILLAVLFFLFKKQVVEYLAVNEPVDAEYLIVEGWMSDHSLNFAVEEFRQHNYSGMIVTGVELEPWYLMPVEGFFEYGFHQEDFLLKEGDSVKVRLKGTPVNGIFPEFSLYFNGKKVGSGSTRESWEEHLFIADTTFSLESLAISFDNDAILGEQDRNLLVGALSINKFMIPARSENSLFFEKSDPQKKRAERVDFSSVAEMAAWSLMKKGIPEEEIIVLPAKRSDVNKTYNSALTVSKWLESESIANASFNILSENIHARRSWVLFDYALRDGNYKVGIITESNQDRDHNIKINNASLLKEIAGNLYYRTLFKLVKKN